MPLDIAASTTRMGLIAMRTSHDATWRTHSRSFYHTIFYLLVHLAPHTHTSFAHLARSRCLFHLSGASRRISCAALIGWNVISERWCGMDAALSSLITARTLPHCIFALFSML